MKMNTEKLKFEYFAVDALREKLRQDALALSVYLTRSVGRLTSCDEQPCLDYGEEVERQQDAVQKLLYLQHCRTALEKCIQSDGFVLSFRFADGDTSRTVFKMVGKDGVKVANLLNGEGAKAE